MLKLTKAGRAASLFVLLMMTGAGHASTVEPRATTPSHLLLSLSKVSVPQG